MKLQDQEYGYCTPNELSGLIDEDMNLDEITDNLPEETPDIDTPDVDIDLDIPEEASGLLCENRENCKTCNADDPLYCDECNDGFMLQKIQDYEYGYCLPDDMDL
jgi:hypothetical protein